MLKDLPQNKTLRKYNNYFQFILIQINQRHWGDLRTASHLFLFLIIYYALFFPRELYLGLYSLKVRFCKQIVYLKTISLEACLKSDYENFTLSFRSRVECFAKRLGRLCRISLRRFCCINTNGLLKGMAVILLLFP